MTGNTSAVGGPIAEAESRLDGGAELIDVRAMSRLLSCSTRHVCRLADGGRMPRPLKLGALLRWRRAEVEAWIEAGCPATRKAGAR